MIAAAAHDVDADRVHDLLLREPHHAAAGSGGGEANDRRGVEAERAAVKYVEDTAEHLVSQHGAGDQVAPAASHQFGSR